MCEWAGACEMGTAPSHWIEMGYTNLGTSLDGSLVGGLSECDPETGMERDSEADSTRGEKRIQG